MNLNEIKAKQPGRPIYVLLHKSQTHIMSLPGGEPDWSYEKKDMELRKQILKKDFKNFNYEVVNAAEAIQCISNKQAELVEAWTPQINLIRKAKTLGERRAIYTRFAKRTNLPHPIEADAMLKRLLAW